MKPRYATGVEGRFLSLSSWAMAPTAAQRWWWSSRVELLKRVKIEAQMSSSSLRGKEWTSSTSMPSMFGRVFWGVAEKP